MPVQTNGPSDQDDEAEEKDKGLQSDALEYYPRYHLMVTSYVEQLIKGSPLSADASEIADDVCDAVFARVVRIVAYDWRKYFDHDGSRDDIRSVFLRAGEAGGERAITEAEFRKYICRAALNRVRDRWRASTRGPGVISLEASAAGGDSGQAPLDKVPARQPSPEEALILKDKAQQCLQAMRELKGVQREVVLLRLLHGLDFSEIKIAIGIGKDDKGLSLVYYHYHRGIEKVSKAVLERDPLFDHQ
jgi:DNA-directed RNA polymerase specialized sigma24 family protein